MLNLSRLISIMKGAMVFIALEALITLNCSIGSYRQNVFVFLLLS